MYALGINTCKTKKIQTFWHLQRNAGRLEFASSPNRFVDLEIIVAGKCMDGIVQKWIVEQRLRYFVVGPWCSFEHFSNRFGLDDDNATRLDSLQIGSHRLNCRNIRLLLLKVRG